MQVMKQFKGQLFHEYGNLIVLFFDLICVNLIYFISARNVMQSLIHINECRVQDIQRTTEKQQELEQQQTDLIGEYSKFSDTFSSTIPGVPKVSYCQDLRPNGGTNQLTSSGQYQQHPIFSTSSVLSATSASVNRTTAAPYSYTSMPSSTLGPTSLGNVVVSSENTSSAYQADIASLQVRLKIYNVFIKQNKKGFIDDKSFSIFGQ